MPGSLLIRLNPLLKPVLLCPFLVLFGAAPLRAASDWNYTESHSDAREFSPGGFVHVRLSVGDMHIRRGDSNRISLRYTIKSGHERNVKEARVDFDVHGNDATIEFHSPSGGNTQFDVEVEVPQKTNLDVHEKVGDVTVENVDGDKDLTLGVGDLRVVNEREGYRLVDASAGIGDVNGAGYGETSGWLGKTLKYHGEGKYALRAHVGVGDIHLDGK
jgi:hypothetical protein